MDAQALDVPDLKIEARKVITDDIRLGMMTPTRLDVDFNRGG